MTLARCPDVGDWESLLDENGAAGEAKDLMCHLETCAECQRTLETLAADQAIWQNTASCLTEAVRKEPALRQVLEQLKSEKALFADEEDLSFLRSVDQPGLLGMFGPYEVQEEIGRGGMGIVLKALDPVLNRVVALKVMSPRLAHSATARRRFIREGQAAAAVCHEHIVTVYHVNEADGLPYLVMQYIAGESLQDRLDRLGPLDVEELVRVAAQTASGLAAAHARGLIHRDIKPANLLLEDSRVKITDFGLARMTDDVRLTQNGVLAGTPEYMAPEQARGEMVDHRADLFSLGSVLYAMGAGVSPFRGSTTLALIRQVSDETPTPMRALNPDVPDWLEAIVARLMAKGPAERYQSAAEVAALLEGFLAHLRQPTTIAAPELPPTPSPVPSRSLGVWEPGRSWQPFTRLFSLLAIVPCVVAALALGIFYWFAGVDEPKPKEDARELHLSLRGIPEDRASWELIGPDAKQCVKFEPEGLRITLPAGFPQERPGTGVRIPLPVRGDFEATIHYEILTEPEPANAGLRPTKLTFLALLVRRERTVAAIARRVSSDKGTQFTTWTVRDNNDNSGTRQAKARQHAAQAKVGRLRIVRTGSEGSFYAAEGSATDFTLLPPPREFGEEDLKSIELVGSTGVPNATLDVRFTDLRVRTGPAVTPPEALMAPRRRSTWILLLTLAVVLSVLPLGVWLALRRDRRDRVEQPREIDAEADQAAAATAPIAFRCPGCAKGLKARAELAGKKIKCPGCSQAVRVLKTRPSVPPPG